MSSKCELPESIPIREWAFRKLKSMIIDGEFQSGERLIERQLAEKLNVSRTPIREALLRLEEQGLVLATYHRGYIVNPFSKESLVEVFEIISSLSMFAAKQATQKRNVDRNQMIVKKIAQLDTQIVEATDETWSYEEFSDVLYQVANSPKLTQVHTNLMDYLQSFEEIVFTERCSIQEMQKLELKILKAILNGEVTMAECLTAVLIDKTKKWYMKKG